MYRDEFYRPYMKYPGKILAVAGNHDGEVFAATDPVPLKAFTDNFCTRTARVPRVASDVRIFRQTMTQPGVYYRLTTPFADIVALYSNIAEGPGSIIGANGDQSQKNWLAKTLADIAKERQTKRKALIFAVHHPPYSNGGHAGSEAMLRRLRRSLHPGQHPTGRRPLRPRAQLPTTHTHHRGPQDPVHRRRLRRPQRLTRRPRQRQDQRRPLPTTSPSKASATCSSHQRPKN